MENNDPTLATTSAARAERRLRERLAAIAAVLSVREDSLAMLELGSMDVGADRVDAHSDLDFFVLVRDGAKPRCTGDLTWLAAAHPLAWHFRNTGDRCKALMSDGMFCEFAVFELRELASIPYSLDRLLELREQTDSAEAPIGRDAFAVDRRVEQRPPDLTDACRPWPRVPQHASVR